VKSKAITLLILIFLSSASCFAGAWNKKKGEGYAQLSFTYLKYSQLLNSNSDKIDLKRDIADNTLQFYSEYGISNRFNVIFNLPYKLVSSGKDLNQVQNDPTISDTLVSGNKHGFSNMGFALRYELINGNYVLSIQAGIQNHMHSYDVESGLRIGYDAYIFTPSILFGKAWSKYYSQAEIGLSLNSSNYAQNTIGNIEVGRNFSKGKTYLILRIDLKLPFTTGHFDEGNTVQTGLFRDNSSYVSPGLKIIQQLKENVFLNIAAYGAVYSMNEGAQATLNIGLAYQW